MKLTKLSVFVIIMLSLFALHLQFSLKETFSVHEGMATITSNTSYVTSMGTVSDDVQAIKKKDIQPGKEDLYILKSQIVPPVCPRCPDVIQNCPKTDCQPCKPCGRCPEPAFECKKVPNYSVINDNSSIRPNSTNADMHGLPG